MTQFSDASAKPCSAITVRRLGIGLLLGVLTLGCQRDPGGTGTDKEHAIERSTTVFASGETHPSSAATDSPVTDRVQAPSRFEVERLVGLLNAQRLDEARAYIKPLLVEQPENLELVLWAARVEESSEHLEAAIELLSEIPKQDAAFGLVALGQSADLLQRLGRFQEAIARYDDIVTYYPQIAIAHRHLASLHNRMGQRQLAIPHLRSLLRLGDITQEELAALLSQRDAAITRSAHLLESGNSIPSASWLSPTATARELASQNKLQEALQLLERYLREASDGDTDRPTSVPDPSSIALLGRIAAELQDLEGIRLWCSVVDEGQVAYSEHWHAIAVLSGLAGTREPRDIESVVAAFSLCVLRDPTDWVAYGMLQNLMNELGQTDRERAFQDRVSWIKRSILASNEISDHGLGSSDATVRLIESLVQLERPLEANAWRMIAASQSSNAQSIISELQGTHTELLEAGQGFPSPSVILCELPIPESIAQLHDNLLTKIRQRFDMADRESIIAIDSTSRNEPNSSGPPQWVSRENEAGLKFRYENANPVRERDFQLYEQFGGGVAALDYDRNGRVDFYFAQSAGEPLKNKGLLPNQLYSQHREGTFLDVTDKAGVGDRGYGLGVAVGDINQDGFDDVLVANFGRNVLYINQGDGTFLSPTLEGVWDVPQWTSSVAIADLSGDGIPDVFEANYIEDERVFDRPAPGPDGRLSYFPGPEDFKPAADRLLVQSPDGRWSEDALGSDSEPAPGLGVLVANFDELSRTNEIFVANDMRPNHYWQMQDGKWWEVAKVKGCAYSGRGGSGASMGIAAADFDHNGRLDLHVTNFYNEPVHLYMQNEQGAFVDKVVPAGLYGDSMAVLGFGTIAGDLDNDGDADLVTVNGHIDDLRFRNAPFQMRPQLFLNGAGRFTLQPFTEESDSESFFRRETVGRGLIRVDWNRDGRLDLVATHLDQPANLVENAHASTNHWIQFECVGTVSERTAIGAILTVRTRFGETKHWVTSGGGYSCHDERMIHVGLGQADRVESVTVQWPSGIEQTFDFQEIDCRLLLIEQTPDVFLISR